LRFAVKCRGVALEAVRLPRVGTVFAFSIIEPSRSLRIDVSEEAHPTINQEETMMTNNFDNQARMRSAAFMSELEIAKKSSHTGAVGLMIRVALVVTFAYLILTSYMLFDVAGPVFISALFLVALFVPTLYRVLRKRRGGRSGRAGEASQPKESPQEG
jgi:hypothetical protein